MNDKEHEHGYTPLMFAALAGKILDLRENTVTGRKDICKLLMDYGAKSYTTNNIGKTASELAAFVGKLV